MMNGTLFIVSDEPQHVPNVSLILSKAKYIWNGPEHVASRLPDDDDIQVISTKRAKQLFGNDAQIIDGVTFYVNDPPQFVTHYYHCFAGVDAEYGEARVQGDTSVQRVGESTSATPVITYISRQTWGRRMLIPADHDKLVKELYKLRDQYGYEVNVVSMEKLSRSEQITLAARTTIMMGVHGNGLTSLVWMNPTPRSTIIEFTYPGGFAFDYEWTARALGITHYGFWGSDYFTNPDTPVPAYPPGFQSNEIPIDGAVVARLCHERLQLVSELDD
ncbi:hypothetical protein ONZ45_g5928 [Pleurotus djamor]|nr:hypothetical protein ONZ45_g5928 [Pleurotus djamor]